MTNVSIETGNENADRVMKVVLEELERTPSFMRECHREGILSMFFSLGKLTRRTNLDDDGEVIDALNYLHEQSFIDVLFSSSFNGVYVWMKSRLLAKTA